MQHNQDTYRVSDETTVGEALFAVPGAAAIFLQHGCDAEVECTEEHHQEYLLVDTSLTCHVDNTDALIADLNAALEADEAVRAGAPDLAATPMLDLIASYPRLQAVLDSFGLDTCCGGELSVTAAAAKHGLDPSAVTAALRQALEPSEAGGMVDVSPGR